LPPPDPEPPLAALPPAAGSLLLPDALGPTG